VPAVDVAYLNLPVSSSILRSYTISNICGGLSSTLTLHRPQTFQLLLLGLSSYFSHYNNAHAYRYFEDTADVMISLAIFVMAKPSNQIHFSQQILMLYRFCSFMTIWR